MARITSINLLIFIPVISKNNFASFSGVTNLFETEKNGEKKIYSGEV